MEGLAKGRIERQIPGADLLVDDGTHLPRPGIDGKFSALIADFVREADAHRPMPAIGSAEARPNMVANPLPAAAIAGAGEDIEASLKPRRKTLRNLDGFMPGVVGGRDAVFDR